VDARSGIFGGVAGQRVARPEHYRHVARRIKGRRPWPNDFSFHREKKELSVYAITAAKSGPKMTKNESNPNGLPGFGGGPRGLVVRNATMSEFANMLQANVVERPVVDQSGLATSRYDFILKWTPDGPQTPLGAVGPNPPPATDNVDAPPDLFTAFQQQLGLKLESTKAAVDVVMIDRVENFGQWRM
jgi:uncharacterized protein (TIGR03435 family)